MTVLRIKHGNRTCQRSQAVLQVSHVALEMNSESLGAMLDCLGKISDQLATGLSQVIL